VVSVYLTVYEPAGPDTAADAHFDEQINGMLSLPEAECLAPDLRYSLATTR